MNFIERSNLDCVESTVDNSRAMFNVKNLLDLQDVSTVVATTSGTCQPETESCEQSSMSGDCRVDHDDYDPCDGMGSAGDNDDVDNEDLNALHLARDTSGGAALLANVNEDELDVGDQVYAYCGVAEQDGVGEISALATNVPTSLIYYSAGAPDGGNYADLAFQYSASQLQPSLSSCIGSNSAAADYYPQWNGSTSWGE